MKKVQLTQEQANKIELAKELKDRRVPLLEYVAKNQEIPNESYRCLKGISLDDLARVLYEPNSYEIKPKYKVGDWKGYGALKVNLGQITRICPDNPNLIFMEVQNKSFHKAFALLEESFFQSELWDVSEDQIKAEKERQLWAKIGREVGEFRVGDVRITDIGDPIYMRNVDYAKARYDRGKLKGFYPVEGFISFEEDASDDEGR